MAKAFSKDMKLDLGTFGGTKACHVLVDMMNHDVIPIREKHRVLAFINDATLKFHGVATITIESVRHQAMCLMKDFYIGRIESMPYPDKFKSYLRNVINHHSRRALKGAI